jgi:RNA polymerase sigma-70 factor (ECF subfamily)
MKEADPNEPGISIPGSAESHEDLRAPSDPDHNQRAAQRCGNQADLSKPARQSTDIGTGRHWSAVATDKKPIMRKATDPDADLVRRLQSLCDNGAMKELSVRFKRKVYGVARSILHHDQNAEDATQEVFCKVYAKINGFEHKSSFETWLLTLTRHHCISMKRAIDLRLAISLQEGKTEGMDGGISGPEAGLLQETDYDLAWQALMSLPEKERHILHLKLIDDLSYNEIAKILGTTTNQVGNQLARAKLHLRMQYDGLTEGGFT